MAMDPRILLEGARLQQQNSANIGSGISNIFDRISMRRQAEQQSLAQQQEARRLQEQQMFENQLALQKADLGERKFGLEQMEFANRKEAVPTYADIKNEAFMRAASGLPLAPEHERVFKIEDTKAQTYTYSPTEERVPTKASLFNMLTGSGPDVPQATVSSMQEPRAQDVYSRLNSPQQAPVQQAPVQQAPVQQAPEGLTNRGRRLWEERQIETAIDRQNTDFETKKALKEERPAIEAGLQNAAQELNSVMLAVEDIVNTSSGVDTGVLGAAQEFIGFGDLAGAISTLKGNTFLQKLDALKQASSTGASGLGPVSKPEQEALANAIAALNQSQSERQLDRNTQYVGYVMANLLRSRLEKVTKSYGSTKIIPENAKRILASYNMYNVDRDEIVPTNSLPVVVDNEDQARRLPSGTVYVLKDDLTNPAIVEGR